MATFAAKHFWILDLASHFQAYYFCAALALLAWNLLLRRRRAAIVATVLLCMSGYHLLPYYLPRDKVSARGTSYKVMLLNLNLDNQKTAAVKAEILATDPDILILQEVTPRWREELKSLPAAFNHSFDLPEDGAFGIWVMSKFKLDDLDVQRRGFIAFLHIRYKVGARPLEVVALHPYPPVGGRASHTRNTILADASVYAAGEGSRIAVGDLNCSPWSPHFRSFLKVSGLRDSARGRGVQGTWLRELLLGIPIDHILVSPDIEVIDRVVGRHVGSDHRPVVVTFQFDSDP